MIYKVTITDTVTYYINSNKEEYTKDDAEQAENLALEWWAERNPIVETTPVTPCQIDGKCPYETARACSECMKGMR